MDEKREEQLINLLCDIKKLLEKSIFLIEKQVRLFEKYDTEAFETEEFEREQRNSGNYKGQNKSILGNSRRS